MEQILQTNGAVGVELFGLAPMVQRVDACAARVAVNKLVVAFHPANATLVTMVVISLCAIVKEVANCAKICSKLNAATFVRACLGYGLSAIALIAYHFFDRVPVHFMALSVVVTVTAHIRLVATRGNQAASSHVVFASYCFAVIRLHIGD